MRASKGNVLSGTIGFLLAALVFLVPVLLRPVPYKDVHIIELRQVNKWVYFTATFVKTDCLFRRLVINGSLLGVTSGPLPYVDRDGPQGNRLKGRETLRINIGEAQGFDTLTIRTRHFCPGALGTDIDERTGARGYLVDGVFAQFDPREVILPPETQSGHGGHLKPVE